MNYDAKIEVISDEGDAETGNQLTSGAEQDRVLIRRFLVGGAIALVLLLGIWFFMHRGGSGELAGNADIQTPAVTVVIPVRTTVQGEINATGTLAARRESPDGSVGEGGDVRSVLCAPGYCGVR